MSNWKKRLLFSSFISFFWFKLTNKRKLLNYSTTDNRVRLKAHQGKPKESKKEMGNGELNKAATYTQFRTSKLHENGHGYLW